jgi:hypothetical protein
MACSNRSIRSRTLSYSQQHFLECNALLAMLKLEAGEPVDVRPPPGFLARIMTTETQQKRGDVLAFDSVVLDRGIASPHEVPHRLMTLVRHPDGGQLTSPEQLREIDGVAPIGLDPITRLGRGQRRRHHDAVMAEALDQPVETVSRRAGLVAERQSSVFAREFSYELAYRHLSIVELAEISNLTVSTGIGNRHRIAQFRRVQRNERFAMMLHDSPPLCEALPGPSGQPSSSHRGRVASTWKGTYGLNRCAIARCAGSLRQAQ